MRKQTANHLQELTGQEVTLRFPTFGVTGRLVGVHEEPWGYLLRISGKTGDHLIPFPGDVLQILLRPSDLP